MEIEFSIIWRMANLVFLLLPCYFPIFKSFFTSMSFYCMQEIAWQRLDELQPASDDVISHGVTGLKLYMVAPFLAWVQRGMMSLVLLKPFCAICLVSVIYLCRSLKKWISAHKPSIAPKHDMPLKGFPYIL